MACFFVTACLFYRLSYHPLRSGGKGGRRLQFEYMAEYSERLMVPVWGDYICFNLFATLDFLIVLSLTWSIPINDFYYYYCYCYYYNYFVLFCFSLLLLTFKKKCICYYRYIYIFF